MINFLTHSELVNNFPDQVAPFHCFGCDFRESFPVRFIPFCHHYADGVL